MRNGDLPYYGKGKYGQDYSRRRLLPGPLNICSGSYRRSSYFRVRLILLFCSLFTTLVCCLILKNFIESDFQLFHWHVPVTTQIPPHLLCVLVPFRDRQEELNVFAPHMHEFLGNQSVSSKIIVINQTDSYRFNRASLINVGWFEADRSGCDYIVMHDVDLLPLNPKLDYSFPGFGTVRHISSPEYHPRYNYTKFIGGVLMLTLKDFKMLNGMSNKYWGWGLEDDEFYLRLKDANLTASLDRPANLTTDRRNTFQHVHNALKRKRDFARIGNQREMSRRRDRLSGLDSVRYRIVSRAIRRFGVDGRYFVLNVELFCDLKWTSYCVLPKPTVMKKKS